MSPVGIQRTVAFCILISPWVYIPHIFKEVLFIIAALFLFISTLDIRRKTPSDRQRDFTQVRQS